MKKSWLHSIRFFLVAMCVVAISSAGAASAHQSNDVWMELGEDFIESPASSESSTIVGNTFVLPTSGAEVVLADGFEPEATDFEDQIIVNTPQGMGAIAVIQGLGSPQRVMESYASAFGGELDGAEQINSQVESELATGLYSVDLLGVSMFLFITVDTSSMPGYMTIQVAIAETDIAGAISLLREIAAVNGQPMFDGIDEHEIQEMADQYQGE